MILTSQTYSIALEVARQLADGESWRTATYRAAARFDITGERAFETALDVGTLLGDPYLEDVGTLARLAEG